MELSGKRITFTDDLGNVSIKTNKNIKNMSYEQMAKLEILNAVNNISSQEDLDELKVIIARFFADKAQKEIDKLWDNGNINEQTIEAWGNEHMRTPYKHA